MKGWPRLNLEYVKEQFAVQGVMVVAGKVFYAQ
jgi:hypothetical protein